MSDIPLTSKVGLVAFWVAGGLLSIPLFGRELLWEPALILTGIAAGIGGLVILLVDGLKIEFFRGSRDSQPIDWYTLAHTMVGVFRCLVPADLVGADLDHRLGGLRGGRSRLRRNRDPWQPHRRRRGGLLRLGVLVTGIAALTLNTQMPFISSPTSFLYSWL